MNENKQILVATFACPVKRDWEVRDYAALEAEARKQLGLKDDGKPLVARHIARSLGSRTPPIVAQSVKRIIEAATVVDWKGSCLKSSAATA